MPDHHPERGSPPKSGSSRRTTSQPVRPDESAPAPAHRPVVGLLEWFRVGDKDHVERVLNDLKSLRVHELRTGISWADARTPEGERWYAWLLPRLAQQVKLLPCFCDTPPGWGVAPEVVAPPGDLKSYADFLDVLITRHGEHFEWIELWNEPNDPRQWDAGSDPYWIKFGQMIGNAAHWAKQRGKKTVLGGMRPIDPTWLRLMGERNLLQYIDAVGIHAFPGSGEAHWDGWPAQVRRVRDVLRQFNDAAEVWITETGYSTWRHDEHRQLTALVDAIDAPVDRVYWYALHDLDPRLSTGRGFHIDERDYHFGLTRADGGNKLLYRLWSDDGLDAVRAAAWLGRSAHVAGTDGQNLQRPTLITGGCGFIGTNLADRLYSAGHDVLLLDNLSRPGVERNLARLRQKHDGRVRVEAADIRDRHALRAAVDRAGSIFHLAAQVAVTTSLVNAVHDFEVNARGTLNLLEAVRAQDTPPPLVYTSTNKVYGGLSDVTLRVRDGRYEPTQPTHANGVNEERPLDFHSPYGCSKGAADQYVIDYARTFGLPACVFRMSCIYGPHQCGNEDQGWIAHFLLRALRGEPITLYGDGMQVRDVLYVDDLIDAFLLARDNINDISAEAFNVGGGPGNTISLLDLLDRIEKLIGHRPTTAFSAWRPGDQRFYVSDTAKISRALGWQPKVTADDGIERLYHWLRRDGLVESPRGNHTPSNNEANNGTEFNPASSNNTSPTGSDSATEAAASDGGINGSVISRPRRKLSSRKPGALA